MNQQTNSNKFIRVSFLSISALILVLGFQNCGSAKMQGQAAADEIQQLTFASTDNESTQEFSGAPRSDGETGSLTESQCRQILHQINENEQAILLHAKSDKAYNELAKAVTRAKVSPVNYVATFVSPSISQGPTIRDMMDGETVLRRDLYYGHDIASQIRDVLEDFGSPTLQANLVGKAEVEDAFAGYVNAFKAMPTFAGPMGKNISGSPKRTMCIWDARELQEDLDTLVSRYQNGCN